MFLSERFRNFLMLIYSLLMPIEVWASLPVKAVEIRMDGEVKVSSERLVLGDVATIYARNLQDFEALSNLVLPQFPADKKEFRLSAEYLKERIAEALGSEKEFSLHAPNQISFSFDKPIITDQDLAREILARGRESGKIPSHIEADVLALGGFEQLPKLRPGSYRIEPASDLASWRGELPFKILLSEGSTQKVHWVRAKLRWFSETWIAGKPLRFQDPLEISAFRKARVDITDLREDLIPATEEELVAALHSARARRGIRENSVLTKQMIDRRPDASPGQRMKVVFVSESGLRVSADGSLLGSGVIGGDAKVKLNSSRKIVSGKLVSGSVMEVSL
jgi:flagella basal body P-ring formation protein FlgA